MAGITCSCSLTYLTLPKCRLLCEVDYESMPSFSSSADLFSWKYFIPLVVVMSVVQVFRGRPRDLLPSIFPSISCICDVLCLIRCPRYCTSLVLNCLTIYLPVPILLNTSSLVIFSVHDIFKTLCDKPTSQTRQAWTTEILSLSMFLLHRIVLARYNILLLSIWSSGLCLDTIVVFSCW